LRNAPNPSGIFLGFGITYVVYQSKSISTPQLQNVAERNQLTGDTVRVCIYGAGAIGGFIGVQLARGGVDVSLVARGPHLAAMRKDGVRLLIGGEERVAKLRCTDNAAELGPQDCLIIALKANAISGAVDAMTPLLGPETTVVTATNGLPYWYFYGMGEHESIRLDTVDPGSKQWDRLGPQRAIGCVVLPATEVVAPGVIRHDHGLKFPIGEPDGKTTPRITALSAAFQAGGLEAPIRADIRDEIWLKLWGNLCFNPISALTLATLDVVIADAGTNAVCRGMMTEMKAVGEKLGLRLRVDIERRIAGAAAVGAHKMSMLQDLERGRPMEIEALVGVIQELGRIAHVPTPTIDVVLALIRLRAKHDPAAAVNAPAHAPSHAVPHAAATQANQPSPAVAIAAR
jgi:2-dehydropantoate 2-reductase